MKPGLSGRIAEIIMEAFIEIGRGAEAGPVSEFRDCEVFLMKQFESMLKPCFTNELVYVFTLEMT